MKQIDPTLVRIAMIVAGVAVGIVAKVYLKGTDIQGEATLAAGWLIGQAMRGPGYIDAKALESLRPPPEGKP